MRSDLVLVQQHVRNPVRDGKLSTCFRTDEGAVDEFYLEEGVVCLLEEFLLVLVVLRHREREVVEVS